MNTRTLKVYISTGNKNYEAARTFFKQLNLSAQVLYPGVKFQLAFDWPTASEYAHTRPGGLEAFRQQRVGLGNRMLAAIQHADLMIVLPGGGQGTYTEAGVFLGLNWFGGRKADRPLFMVEGPDHEYSLSPFYATGIRGVEVVAWYDLPADLRVQTECDSIVEWVRLKYPVVGQ